MSNQRPTPHSENVLSATVQLTRQDSKPMVEVKKEESMEVEMSPEEIAAYTDVSNLLVTGKMKRELDMIDGLQNTAEVIDKVLSMMGEIMEKVVALEDSSIGSTALKDLMERVRALEDRCQSPTPSKNGCNWNCNKNSFSI